MNTTTRQLTIGDKLRKLRTEKGYSQEYFADKLNLSQKTISNMENDKSTISIETLKKVASELDIDLIELLADGKVIVQYNTSQDTSTFNGVVNQSPNDTIISDYKLIINEYKEIIEDLKRQVVYKDSLLVNLNK